LDAAGADRNKILRLESVMLKDGQGRTLQQRELQLDTDIQEIKKVVEANPGIKLVVIDPISSYLGKIRMNDEQEVRRVLKPLVGLARQKQFAVVLIIHFNKNREAKSAIDRVGGAKGLIGLGRAAWTCHREPKDEDDLSPADRHLFLKLKNNLVPSKVGGLVYEIKARKVQVRGKHGPEMVDVPYIEWVGTTNTIAQDVLIEGKAPTGKLDAAKVWLERHLEQKGGIDTRASVVELAEAAGHSERTLDRAKVELRIKTVFPDGPEAHWALPGHKNRGAKKPVKFGGYGLNLNAETAN
jgi:hypothetical protein